MDILLTCHMWVTELLLFCKTEYAFAGAPQIRSKSLITLISLDTYHLPVIALFPTANQYTLHNIAKKVFIAYTLVFCEKSASLNLTSFRKYSSFSGIILSAATLWTSDFLWPPSIWILQCLQPLFCKLLLLCYWKTICGNGVEYPAQLKPLSHLGTFI